MSGSQGEDRPQGCQAGLYLPSASCLVREVGGPGTIMFTNNIFPNSRLRYQRPPGGRGVPIRGWWKPRPLTKRCGYFRPKGLLSSLELLRWISRRSHSSSWPHLAWSLPLSAKDGHFGP